MRIFAIAALFTMFLFICRETDSWIEATRQERRQVARLQAQHVQDSICIVQLKTDLKQQREFTKQAHETTDSVIRVFYRTILK